MLPRSTAFRQEKISEQVQLPAALDSSLGPSAAVVQQARWDDTMAGHEAQAVERSHQRHELQLLIAELGRAEQELHGPPRNSMES